MNLQGYFIIAYMKSYMPTASIIELLLIVDILNIYNILVSY